MVKFEKELSNTRSFKYSSNLKVTVLLLFIVVHWTNFTYVSLLNYVLMIEWFADKKLSWENVEQFFLLF